MLQVVSDEEVQAVVHKPGFETFCSQHALQQELISFLKSHPGPAHMGTHVGTFAKKVTKEESKVTSS